MRGRTSEARPRMTRVRERARPPDSKARRASRWISGSTSMVVSTPSGPIPSRIHRPDTPVPVPISATERAATEAASMRSAAPVAGVTGAVPSSMPRRRACAATSGSMGNSSV